MSETQTTKEKYFFDGYHQRAEKLLRECEWALAMPNAMEQLPFWADMSRLKILERVKAFTKEFEAESAKQQEEYND